MKPEDPMHNGSEETDLEQFVHRELRRLPDLQAPSFLIMEVKRRLERREHRPWWQQPLWQWPAVARSAGIALLTILALVVVLGGPWLWRLYANEPGALVGANTLWTQIESTWLWMASWVSVWANSIWLWAAIAVSGVAYVCLIGIGTCLFRLAPQGSNRELSTV